MQTILSLNFNIFLRLYSWEFQTHANKQRAKQREGLPCRSLQQSSPCSTDNTALQDINSPMTFSVALGARVAQKKKKNPETFVLQEGLQAFKESKRINKLTTAIC